MTFVPIVEPRISNFFMYFGCVARFRAFLQGFMKWLVENQITLKSNIFNPDIISNTFTSSDIAYGPAKQTK